MPHPHLVPVVTATTLRDAIHIVRVDITPSGCVIPYRHSHTAQVLPAASVNDKSLVEACPIDKKRQGVISVPGLDLGIIVAQILRRRAKGGLIGDSLHLIAKGWVGNRLQFCRHGKRLDRF